MLSSLAKDPVVDHVPDTGFGQLGRLLEQLQPYCHTIVLMNRTLFLIYGLFHLRFETNMSSKIMAVVLMILVGVLISKIMPNIDL